MAKKANQPDEVNQALTAVEKLDAARAKYKVNAPDAQILELAGLIKEVKQSFTHAKYIKDLKALRAKK